MGAVAGLRNYEAEWLKADLSLVEDLGLTEVEREKLAETLGLPVEQCVGTLRSIALDLERPRVAPAPDLEPLPILTPGPTQTHAWTLLIGVASPDTPSLTDWLIRSLDTHPSPCIEARGPQRHPRVCRSSRPCLCHLAARSDDVDARHRPGPTDRPRPYGGAQPRWPRSGRARPPGCSPARATPASSTTSPGSRRRSGSCSTPPVRHFQPSPAATSSSQPRRSHCSSDRPRSPPRPR